MRRVRCDVWFVTAVGLLADLCYGSPPWADDRDAGVAGLKARR
jgi:hypothetical protein